MGTIATAIVVIGIVTKLHGLCACGRTMHVASWSGSAPRLAREMPASHGQDVTDVADAMIFTVSKNFTY
ncbi:hypothetical protein [Massilia sp. DWR3-1-1]|uniref:hypothetical protein n=1 Tax=Massilia sp. DWR3-1-1 TaxID=2804559 RepID=UPI003CF94116